MDRTYTVTLESKTPMLMHADNIEWQERCEQWRLNPEHTKFSVAGDDRSPGFTWLGSLYHDGEHVAVPQDNIMRCLMEAGAMVPVPKAKGSRGGKTFKEQTQSGLMCSDQYWVLESSGKRIPIEPLFELENEMKFVPHLTRARSLGFELFTKRAAVGQSKHVRVRPMFGNWRITGTVVVWDPQIDTKVLTQIFELAGNRKGLGDWRPGAKKSPGVFGRFTATVKGQ